VPVFGNFQVWVRVTQNFDAHPAVLALLLIGADLERGALPKVAGHGGVAAPAPLGELRVERGAGFDERRETAVSMSSGGVGR
jgi:hypothetical protein